MQEMTLPKQCSLRYAHTGLRAFLRRFLLSQVVTMLWCTAHTSTCTNSSLDRRRGICCLVVAAGRQLGMPLHCATTHTHTHNTSATQQYCHCVRVCASCCLQLAGATAGAAEANGMEVDGQPAASTSGRKLFVGSQELGYKRPHMEVRTTCCRHQHSHFYCCVAQT